jgi:hypothetical protein
MLGEGLAERTKLPTRFIVYLCDRAVANSAEYIALCGVYRGRYCDSLRAGRFGLRALVWPKVLSFQHPSSLAPAPVQPPVQWAPRLFPSGKRLGCGLATYPHLCLHVMLQGDIFLYVVWCTRVLYNMPDRPLKGSGTTRGSKRKRQSDRFRDQGRSTGNGRLEKRNSAIKRRSGKTQTGAFAKVRKRSKLGLSDEISSLWFIELLNIDNT